MKDSRREKKKKSQWDLFGCFIRPPTRSSLHFLPAPFALCFGILGVTWISSRLCGLYLLSTQLLFFLFFFFLKSYWNKNKLASFWVILLNHEKASKLCAGSSANKATTETGILQLEQLSSNINLWPFNSVELIKAVALLISWDILHVTWSFWQVICQWTCCYMISKWRTSFFITCTYNKNLQNPDKTIQLGQCLFLTQLGMAD